MRHVKVDTKKLAVGGIEIVIGVIEIERVFGDIGDIVTLASHTMALTHTLATAALDTVASTKAAVGGDKAGHQSITKTNIASKNH